jgi:hypothetical protein
MTAPTTRCARYTKRALNTAAIAVLVTVAVACASPAAPPDDVAPAPTTTETTAAPSPTIAPTPPVHGIVLRVDTQLSDDNTVTLAMPNGFDKFTTAKVDWGDGTEPVTVAPQGCRRVLTDPTTGMVFANTILSDASADECVGAGRSWRTYEGAVDVASHTYAAEGDYTITIIGPAPVFGGLGSGAVMLTEVVSLGSVQVLTDAFANTPNLRKVPKTLPDSVITLRGAFARSAVNDPDIATWDVTNVGVFADLFAGASEFNQDLSGWATCGRFYIPGGTDNVAAGAQAWVLPQPNFGPC